DDAATVSRSTLPRQVTRTPASEGAAKVDSATSFAAALNPHVEIVPHRLWLTTENAGLVGDYDLVLDGTDNFATRKATAEACAAAGKPLVSGAVSMFDGQVTVFAPGGPGFADLYPQHADEVDLPACEVVGVLGAVTGVIGTLMAMEAIKLITGLGEPLIGRLLLYDGRAARFTELGY